MRSAVIGGGLPPFVQDIATLCGAFTIILVFVAAVARIRWVRWVWAHLVSIPLGTWLTESITKGASSFHEQWVAPALVRIELKADQAVESSTSAAKNAETALAYAKQVAEAQGFPPGMDPTERVRQQSPASGPVPAPGTSSP